MDRCCEPWSRSCAAPRSRKTSQRRSRCPQRNPRCREPLPVCANATKQSARLASTVSTNEHLVAGAAFHRQSRASDSSVGIVVRGVREVWHLEGTPLVDSEAPQPTPDRRSCKMGAHRGELRPKKTQIRPPRSRGRARAMRLRVAAFGQGLVRTRRAKPRSKRCDFGRERAHTRWPKPAVTPERL